MTVSRNANQVSPRPTSDGTLTATVESSERYLVGDGAAATVKLISRAIKVWPEAIPSTVNEDAGDVAVTVIARTEPGVPKPRSSFTAYLDPYIHIPQPPDVDPLAASARDYHKKYEFPSFAPSDFVADGEAFVARKEITVLSIIDDRRIEGPETVELLGLAKTSSGRGTKGAVSWIHSNGTSCRTSRPKVCSFPLTIVDNDAPPVITTPGRIVVAAGETTVTTLTATDPDTDVSDLIWGIEHERDYDWEIRAWVDTYTEDSGKFELIEDGEGVRRVLAFREAKDPQAPDDGDADGNYEVRVWVGGGSSRDEALLVVALEGADSFPPTLEDATVYGTTLALTWSELLDETSVPRVGAFSVAAGSTAHAVIDVAVAGKTVTLAETSPVRVRSG